jgi:hypothetical protein
MDEEEKHRVLAIVKRRDFTTALVALGCILSITAIVYYRERVLVLEQQVCHLREANRLMEDHVKTGKKLTIMYGRLEVAYRRSFVKFLMGLGLYNATYAQFMRALGNEDADVAVVEQQRKNKAEGVK